MQRLFQKKGFFLYDLADLSDSPQIWTVCAVIGF